MTFTSFILFLSNLPILAVGLYAITLRDRLRGALLPIAIFSWVAIIVQAGSVYFWFQSWNNLPFLHVFTPLGVICISWFYMRLWDAYIPSWVLTTIAASFVVFSIVNTIWFQDVKTFNSNAITVQCILITIYALSSFFLAMEDQYTETMAEKAQGYAWINAGLFIYYASSIVFFSFGEVMMTRFFDKEDSRVIWTAQAFFSTVMYISIFIGLWKSPKQ